MIIIFCPKEKIGMHVYMCPVVDQSKLSWVHCLGSDTGGGGGGGRFFWGGDGLFGGGQLFIQGGTVYSCIFGRLMKISK